MVCFTTSGSAEVDDKRVHIFDNMYRVDSDHLKISNQFQTRLKAKKLPKYMF